jgi:hypothetical protein
MPASLKQIRDGGGMVLLHICETCGTEATFGFGMLLRHALNKLAAGDKIGAKRNLGRWYCREHKANAGDGAV